MGSFNVLLFLKIKSVGCLRVLRKARLLILDFNSGNTKKDKSGLMTTQSECSSISALSREKWERKRSLCNVKLKLRLGETM